VLNAYPLGQSLWLSFQRQVIRPELHYVPAGLDQYAKVLTDPLFVKGTLVMLRFIGLSVIMSVLIGLGLALILNGSFRGRGVFRALFLLPWAISEYSTGLIWKFVLREDIGFANAALSSLGLIQEGIVWINPTFAIEAVAVAFVWHLAPLAGFFFLAGLQFIPRDLYRQATIDGAGAFRRFRSVTLPFLRYPMLITIALVTVFASKTLDIIITMTGGGPAFGSSTLTNVIYVRTFAELNFPYGAAMSWYVIIIVVALVVAMFWLMTRTSRLISGG
jgi:ABC-type sugar transport system permease subunit